MEIKLWWSQKLPTEFEFSTMPIFLQKMVNRILQGNARYGEPSPERRYMTRLEVELKHYKHTGNAEYLVNVANYAYLEFVAPENPKFHWDPRVPSATRRAER